MQVMRIEPGPLAATVMVFDVLVLVICAMRVSPLYVQLRVALSGALYPNSSYPSQVSCDD